ncbi:MAG TPA: 4-alpha-glucanotransferase, partial [Burkholderiales bacterium]|nr:4-alpha-glucanotransferase [Burkholderiales bacterium]
MADEVASSYLDVWGNEKPIEPEVRRVLLEAMGPRRKARKVRLATGRCYQPKLLEERRLWGFTAQLYGLRSERNWGIGDFTDLHNLIEIAAGLGGAVVGVNPLHATQGSPYSPSSRHALNFLYIDVEAVPGYEPSAKLHRRLRALRDSDLVDYAGVRRVKLEALEGLFKKQDRKVRPGTRALREYAVFEALREELGGGWQNWPEAFHRPESKAVKV